MRSIETPRRGQTEETSVRDGPNGRKSSGSTPTKSRRSHRVGAEPSFRPEAGKSSIFGIWDTPALLRALRFRWGVALSLGLASALIVGLGALAGLWYFMPPQFTTFALLRVSSAEPRLVFNTTEKESDFRTYKAIQATLLKSPLVLNDALRQPHIAALRWVRERQDALTEMDKHLRADYPGDSEILRVSMSDDDPAELAMLVNGVTDAYLKNVVHADRKRRLERLQELDRIYNESEEKARSKRTLLRQLARALGTSDSKVLTLKQQMAVEHFAELRREHTRVQFDLMRAKLSGDDTGTADTTPTDSEIPDLILNEYVQRDPIAGRLTQRITQLQEIIARYAKIAVVPDEPTLVNARDELESLQSTLQTREQELRLGAVQLAHRDARNVPRREESQTERVVGLLTEQEKVLRGQIEAESAEVDKVCASSSELELMRAECEEMDNVTKRIHTELESLRVELQSPARVNLVQTADVPRTQDRRWRAMLVALAAIGAFAGCVFFVGLWELRSHRIRSAQEVCDDLGIPVMGELPAIRL